MFVNDLLPIFGLSISALAGSIFSVKLYFNFMKNKENAFFKYFMGFFVWYTLYFIILLLRIPNFIFAVGTPMIAIFQVLKYIAILVSAAYLIQIIALYLFPKIKRKRIFVLSIIFIIINIILLIDSSLQPILLESNYYWQVPKGLIISMMSFGEIPFLIVLITFYYQAIKDKENRKKYILLGTSFLFWVIAGSVFSISNNLLRVTGYVLLITGTISSYLALFSKNK